jgi:hypothetical protein
MYQLYPAAKDATKPVGEWNHFVKCQKTQAGTYKCDRLRGLESQGGQVEVRQLG